MPPLKQGVRAGVSAMTLLAQPLVPKSTAWQLFRSSRRPLPLSATVTNASVEVGSTWGLAQAPPPRSRAEPTCCACVPTPCCHTISARPLRPKTMRPRVRPLAVLAGPLATVCSAPKPPPMLPSYETRLTPPLRAASPTSSRRPLASRPWL